MNPDEPSLGERKKLVFLHIPKTAGQSIRQELRRAFGRERESPVWTKTRARAHGGTCFPDPGRYDLYSGHIDWHDLDEQLRGPRVVFTVLRAPRERLASFYFYQLANSADVAPPARAGGRRPHRLESIRSLSVDDYLANPSLERRDRIDAAYDNVQTRYLATRRLHSIRDLPTADAGEAMLTRAVANAAGLDLVCTIDTLARVEALVRAEFGFEIAVTRRFANRGTVPVGRSRFEELCARIHSPRTRDRIEEMCALDDRLLAALVEEA
jgi:hypothetical protein